jgi:hypothetical protein
MRTTLRRLLAVVAVVVCFLAPAGAAYALWSVTATGSVSVTTATAPVVPTGATYYLENPGTGNTTSSSPLPLGTTAPTATTLPNYDTNRDGAAGLLLAKGGGLGESDTTKHQLWSVPGPITANAPVKLRLWSAMKDFNTAKKGSVVAGLYRCNNNANFTNCDLLAQSTVTSPGAWTTGGGWAMREWSFDTVDLDIASNRRLYVKLAVTSASEDDMWFAYDTAAQPSALVIG